MVLSLDGQARLCLTPCVFILVGTLVTLFGLVALILTAPGAKRPKHDSVK
jgi:hypothetical protein